MLATTMSAKINCQVQTVRKFALENVMFHIYNIYNRDKFFRRLTVFHCGRTATQNNIVRLLFKLVHDINRFDTFLKNHC